MDTQATPLRDLLTALESPSDAYLHSLTPYNEEWQAFLNTKGHELDVQMTQASSAADFHTKMSAILSFIKGEHTPEFLQALNDSLDDITLLHNSALIAAQHFRRQYPSGNKVEDWQTVCVTNENITLPKAIIDILINNDSIRLSLLERLNTDIHRGAQILRTPAESISARSAQAQDIESEKPAIPHSKSASTPTKQNQTPYIGRAASAFLRSSVSAAFWSAAIVAYDIEAHGYDNSLAKRVYDVIAPVPELPKP